MAWITGYADDQPIIPRGPCDPLAGLHAAVATLTALVERDRTGTGQFVESIMLEAALNTCAEPIVEHSAYGLLMERMGNRSPGVAPQGIYACQPVDSSIAISVGSDAQWEGLRAVLDQPGWADESRFATSAGRIRDHDLLDDRLRQWAATDHRCRRRGRRTPRAGGAGGRGWDPRALHAHPQYRDRGFFEDLDHPSIGVHPVPGLPYRFASVDRWTHRATATMGMDNADVLTRILGLGPAEIADLQAGGVIGTRPQGL